jgi:uncharacterized damage-inducible protein DinB
MNADQAKVVGDVIGQAVQREWMQTYKVINAVPDARKDYKPADNSRSAWDLAHHIAVCDVGFLEAVANNSFASFPAKTDARTIPQLADWYKHQMPKALEKVLTLDGNHLSQIVEAFGMKLPSFNYLMFCNNHMIHHRGQLTAYLRPMGAKVPAIIGNSFDEKMGG